MNQIKKAPTHSEQQEELYDKLTKKQIRKTLTAVAICFFVSICIFYSVPTLKKHFIPQGNTNYIQKSVQITKEGSQILFYKNSFIQSNVEVKNSVIKLSDEAVRKNLEILKRRWERQEFSLLSLPGLQNTDVYKNILSFKNKYNFMLTENDDAFILDVTSTNSRAIQALHTYTLYIQKYWK